MRRTIVVLAMLSMSCIEFYRPLPINSDAVSIIRGASRVESFRIDSVQLENYSLRGGAPPFKTFGRVGKHYITAVGPVLDRPLARRASALLRDPKSYRLKDPENIKLCLPRYRHALRFSKGDRSATILICFECATLRVLDEAEHALGGGDFDPMAPQLRALFDEVLPGDAPHSEPN